VTKLVDQRAADEAGGSRDERSHGRRVYWRACVPLAATLVLAGCHGSGSERREQPQPPAEPQLTFKQLDRMQQRIVVDYQPVSRVQTDYDITFRDWRAGKLSDALFVRRARTFRAIVLRALRNVRRDPATGETRRGKALLVSALTNRARALAALPNLVAYTTAWNRSLADARAGLSVLQDIRDRARLIPLPEDSVS